ncbi:hypothetical protein FIV42_12605 [Persicimonas caeni]|uniref:Uncharacterized protein n=1 Tax=Persicimonas caeni TaxID=2292766 RepID=A0A4Y6PUX6_PERCE|nr:hypothetical protein [Persicimonas caeni]QDG51555.1 hypothetical protein FIV42_12605 [Persicimonas caeni]QED32776.1 hypothetical protein FRD00_12600 [Persicimonas caeni]
MTEFKFNDRPIAIFFAIVGVLGTLPALYGLWIAGAVTMGVVSSLVAGRGATELVHLVISLGFISVTLFGFWLLLQYVRRALGREASVSKAKLWRLSAVDNTIYFTASFAVVGINSGGGWMGIASILWFTLLFSLSISAAVFAADEQRALEA